MSANDYINLYTLPLHQLQTYLASNEKRSMLACFANTRGKATANQIKRLLAQS